MSETAQAEIRPIDDDGVIQNAQLAVSQRRELALQATGAISEVLEVDVTVGALIRLADAEEATGVRLAAKRALRCVVAIAEENSPVVELCQNDETGVYHFAEGVILYGADRNRYLQLAGEYELNAEQTTALYALREQIAEESDGSKPGFAAMVRALASVGITPSEAASDTDAALAALDDAGHFVSYLGKRVFDRPIFAPHHSPDSLRLVEDDDDGSVTKGIIWSIHDHLSRPPEEAEY